MEPLIFIEIVINRYAIIKRTKTLPLYHPYLYNYGRNKEQYFRMLNSLRIIYKEL